ncbi:SEC10/PgrA surface exclusion domain-containing protein [Streptococcus sanguinis]|uniref:Gram-positive cocci surface proteins LPxTG domain-containing protein n=1 Tax=Streptococcus sanguinis TaxID=1305 RepID=A0A0B7GMN6_STRSA|nr:SEC10/PgrA surface exclusion domain-containing protein [Streptococcus sanguinis]CEL89501.1 conserved surface-anchored protein of unknown function [Streptococcus sanguinis]
MKKIQKHVILGAAVLASTGFAHTVAADTTPVDANAPANQDKALSASPEAVKQQIEQVNQAKASVDQAKEQVTAAETKVETAKKDNADTSAQKIAEAQAAVTEAEKKVAPAENVAKQAQAALDTAKKAENTQATVAQDAQAQAAKAQTETQAAQDAVNAAQKDVDSKLVSEKVTKAKEELDKAQKNLDSYQDQLKTAEAEDAKRQAVIDQAQADIKAAQAEIKEKEAKLSSQDQVHNTFTLSQAYINALKSDYIKQSLEAQTIFKEEVTKLKLINNYISNPKDAQRMVNINAIPNDVLMEINYYAQDLINQIRKQAGTAPAVLTQNTIDYASALSQAGREQTLDFNKRETGQILTFRVVSTDKVIAKFGLDKFGYNRFGFPQLDYYPVLDNQENVSVDYLKKVVYENVKFQLFDIKESSISGTSLIWAQKVVGYKIGQEKVAYMGVGFSNNGKFNRIQFVILGRDNSWDVEDPSKITPALINPNANNQEADAARKDLAVSQAKLDAAQRTLTNAQNKQETAPLLREVVKTAKDKLAKAERTYQAELENSKNSASEETKAKLAVLAKAQASLKEKESAQASAQKTAEEANAKLEALKAATANAQEKATAAATALAEAQSAVQAAKDYVTRLQNAPALLKAAEAALNDAKANLASKEETYRVENAKLEALKAALAALETDDPTNLVSKNERKVLKVTTTGVKKGKKPVQTYQAPAALPKTGSAESSLALVGMGLLSMLGLAFAKRRKA